VKASAEIAFAKAKLNGSTKSPNQDLKARIPFQMPPVQNLETTNPVGWVGMYKNVRMAC
jgi:hypothetical protein